MTDLRQAAQQALEALEHHSAIKHPQQIHYRDTAIAALKAALEQQQVAPPPEWPLIKNILAVFGLDAIAFVAEWKAAQQQAEPLTEEVIVPLKVLEAVEDSLDSFCGNLGWGDADLQNMDNISALIAQHKAAHNIKEGT